jgi:hypothetical protein
MQKLHKGSSENLAPEEEQPTPLCSNKDAAGCSSLGYKRRFKESDTKSDFKEGSYTSDNGRIHH